MAVSPTSGVKAFFLTTLDSAPLLESFADHCLFSPLHYLARTVRGEEAVTDYLIVNGQSHEVVHQNLDHLIVRIVKCALAILLVIPCTVLGSVLKFASQQTDGSREAHLAFERLWNRPAVPAAAPVRAPAPARARVQPPDPIPVRAPSPDPVPIPLEPLREPRETLAHAVKKALDLKASIRRIVDEHLTMLSEFEKSIPNAPPLSDDNQNPDLAMVRKDGLSLKFAKEASKSNWMIVRTAIGHRAHEFFSALEFADVSLKNDKQLVRFAVFVNIMALSHASPELQKDRDVILTALWRTTNRKFFIPVVCRDHAAIEPRAHCSLTKSIPDCWTNKINEIVQQFSRDREIVIAAVTQHPESLEFADESLKADELVVFAAVSESADAIKFAHRSLNNNKSIALRVVKSGGSYALDTLKDAFENRGLQSLAEDPDVIRQANLADEINSGRRSQMLQQESDHFLQF